MMMRVLVNHQRHPHPPHILHCRAEHEFLIQSSSKLIIKRQQQHLPKKRQNNQRKIRNNQREKGESLAERAIHASWPVIKQKTAVKIQSISQIQMMIATMMILRIMTTICCYSSRYQQAFHLQHPPVMDIIISAIHYLVTIVPLRGYLLQLTKNRQIRRMTAAVGFPLLRLVRVRIGSVMLDGMVAGEVRELNDEIIDLII